eukprot:jgi/Astpho2/2340/Aster-05606
MSAALLHQLPTSTTTKAINYRPHARLQPLGPRSFRPQLRYCQQLRQQSAPLRGHLHQKDLFSSSARTLGHGLRCYSSAAASFRLQSPFKAVSQATAAPRDTGHAAALADSMRRAASTPLGPARSQRQLQIPARHAEAEDASAVQNAVNSGMGFILGDILAQRITGESFDAVRSLELGLYGAALDGPAKHWLNRALTNFKGVKGAVSNGAARNLVWMPIVTCLLYAGLKMAEGNPDDILANCQDKLLSMMVSNAVLWPLSRWVNEKLVPETHRSMSTKIVRVVWSAWLSTLGHAPSIADLADQGGLGHTVSDLVSQFVPVSRAQEAVQNQVSHAIHNCVEQVVSPFLHQAADAMQDATAMLERVPSAALEKAFSKSLDVISPLERITRTPSELLEAGAMGAGVGAGMHRAASHVYQHAPAAARSLQHGAKEMRKEMRSNLMDMNRASSRLLDLAAARCIEASASFERAASQVMEGRSNSRASSLDLAIDQVLSGMQQDQQPQQPSHSSPRLAGSVERAATRSRFAMETLQEATAC